MARLYIALGAASRCASVVVWYLMYISGAILDARWVVTQMMTTDGQEVLLPDGSCCTSLTLPLVSSGSNTQTDDNEFILLVQIDSAPL